MIETSLTLDSENGPKAKRRDDEFTDLPKDETVAHAADLARRLDGFDESINHPHQENTPIHTVICLVSPVKKYTCIYMIIYFS